MSELTPADVVAMQRDDGLFGGNCGSIIILILFFLMMGGGFWNRGDSGLQGSLTRAEMSDGFTMQNVQNDIKGLGSTLYGLNNTVQSGFAEMQKCCCETNRNIDALRFENAQNTCAITTAVHDEAEKTRALFTAQQIQDLRDSREAMQRELQSAQLTLANASQTQNLLGNLGRFVPWGGCSNTCGGF